MLGRTQVRLGFIVSSCSALLAQSPATTLAQGGPPTMRVTTPQGGPPGTVSAGMGPTTHRVVPSAGYVGPFGANPVPFGYSRTIPYVGAPAMYVGDGAFIAGPSAGTYGYPFQVTYGYPCQDARVSMPYVYPEQVHFQQVPPPWAVESAMYSPWHAPDGWGFPDMPHQLVSGPGTTPPSTAATASPYVLAEGTLPLQVQYRMRNINGRLVVQDGGLATPRTLEIDLNGQAIGPRTIRVDFFATIAGVPNPIWVKSFIAIPGQGRKFTVNAATLDRVAGAYITLMGNLDNTYSASHLVPSATLSLRVSGDDANNNAPAVTLRETLSLVPQLVN